MLWSTLTQLCVSLSLFAFRVEVTAIPPSVAPSGGSRHGAQNTTNRVVNGNLAQQYMVPRKLPLINFPLPQTYAGLIDVSESPKQINKLFFWFVPTNNPAGRKDLALWSNGGPGCSSLLGAFQENGPLMWDAGKRLPVANPNSWHTQANMLYLEHPANVGFSTGNAVIDNQDQVALYIFKFLQKFIEIFPEMHGANFYLTGESYAGLYVTYAAEYIYKHQAQLALNLQGILLVDPVISIDAFQSHAPTLHFIQKWNDKYLKLSPKDVAEITALDAKCGGSKYIKDNLKFPPKEFPMPGKLTDDPECQIWAKMDRLLPASFNVYNIAQQKNGFDFTLQTPSYFDRADVRKALNAEQGGRHWIMCSNSSNIFPSGDTSLVPVGRALPYVIDHSKRTVILHGALDGLLLLEGTILSIQGFKWGNKFGFQNPVDRNFVVGGVSKGKYQSERGLAFIAIEDSGHMVPHDQPEAALSAFEYLLGRRPTL